jgi:DHA3 family tetracycline resistance protein-like MFS transporter
LVVAGGAVALALAGEIWLAVLAWLAVAIAREVAWPLQDTWINQQVDSRVRATVLSMSGQMDAAGQILGGPVLGAIGTFWSIRAALFASGLLLTPGIGVYARAWRAGGGNDVASAPPQDA